jgi:hypothetical protein
VFISAEEKIRTKERKDRRVETIIQRAPEVVLFASCCHDDQTKDEEASRTCDIQAGAKIT